MNIVSKFFLHGRILKDNAIRNAVPCISIRRKSNFEFDVEVPEFTRKNFPWPSKADFSRYPNVPDKHPGYPRAIRPMRKMLYLMRGEEEIHNTLIYREYGLQALGGGRLAGKHFNFFYNAISKWKRNDIFVVWRVDPPWQAVSKKGGGKKMGKGKASIHHYVTPVKSGRMILEAGGYADPKEFEIRLAPLAENLPFKARFVTQNILEKEKERKIWEEKNNLNPYTFKYCVLNNMGGCNNWLSPYDYIYLDGRM